MKLLYTSVLFMLLAFSASAQLTGINPNTGFASQQNLATTITSSGLFQTSITPSGNIYEVILQQGANVITILDMMSYGWGNSCTAIDANTADLLFNISGTAVTGVYDLKVTTTDPIYWGTNLQTYTLPACFTITPPDAYLSGKVYYDANFNGVYDAGDTGLSNQYLTLTPGNTSVYTDANGDYTFGVMNGTHTITWWNNSTTAYILNSDSASYTINVNSANQTGLDFGGIDGLVSASPGTAFQGQTLNAIVVSRDLFLTGPNPWGNIVYGHWVDQSTGYSYYINSNSFTVLDTNRAQILFNVPLNMPVGTFRLRLSIGNGVWYLENALQVTAPPSYLTGHIFYDANNNGQFDTGELPIHSQKASLIPDNSFAFSDANGDFTFGAALGTHTLSWVSTSGQYVLSSQPSYSFTNTGNQSGFDFALRSALPDYTANIYFNNAFMRCNQNVTSYVTFTNTSNVVAQGTVYMIHSPNVIFSYANPPRSAWNGDTTFWNFSNLQPFETRSIAVTMMNPGVGSTVWFDTHIDVTDGLGAIQYSYSAPRYQTVVRCSFDPNDKAVTPEGVDDLMHYTLMSDSLDYLIRFQNSGNDTAFTVFIRDTLDVSLDLSTFELLATSHSAEVQIDSNRAVTFLFNNILLPDSNVDEPNSHGYIRYRIHPLSGLPDPTRIENQAFIYFDQNPAIETNITWNTLVNQIPVGLDPVVQIDNAVQFYPNPMDKSGRFVFSNAKAERVLILLTDISGKVVLKTATTEEQYILNKGNLAAGLYFFRLLNSVTGETHTGKITIR